MAGNTTQNTSAVIKAQVYSDVILETLQDGFLPDGLARDVSDFGNGEKLFIPTVGETVIHDYAEDTPAKYDPVDTGQVTLQINQYKQGGTYVTDKLKQDAYALAAVESQIPSQFLYKIREAFETDLLSQANQQTTGNANAINGFDHRWIASDGSTANTIGIDDFIYMRLAFEKANVPEGSWVAIVDPICEATLNNLAGQHVFDQRPTMTPELMGGFAQNHKFLYNLMGFDVWTSNRLPRIASETISSNSNTNVDTSITDGVANVFMSMQDDMTKPFMSAWRQQPAVVGEYNKDFFRDEYVVSARWGNGLQRKDTLGVVITSTTDY